MLCQPASALQCKIKKKNEILAKLGLKSQIKVHFLSKKKTGFLWSMISIWEVRRLLESTNSVNFHFNFFLI